ncbi:MAG TPA: FadR/GntR family transcriptional regulator [Jatrophihabitans sp.]|jgi:DNA-binding FadR family transcriptional regulator
MVGHDRVADGGSEAPNDELDDLAAAIVKGQSRQPVNRRYLAVADGILAAIGTGHLAPGDRLPNERLLAQICGASRTTVRDALLALELFGVVEVRPGSGCYVSNLNPPRRRTSSIMLDSIPRELLEARLHVEPVVAGICAGHVGQEGIARLRRLIDACEQEGSRAAPDDLGPFLKLSHEFHAELAVHCGNSILADLTRQLVDVTAHPLWQVVNAMHVRNPVARAEQIAEHRKIVDAVERGDSEGASAAMRYHLGGLEINIFGAQRPEQAIKRQRPRSR